MASSKISHFSQDHELWDSLKQAIAHSSGFKSWLQDKGIESGLTQELLDTYIRNYLRETLETLAY